MVLTDLEMQDRIRSSLTADQVKSRLNASNGEMIEATTVAEAPMTVLNEAFDQLQIVVNSTTNPASQLLASLLEKNKQKQQPISEDAGDRQSNESDCRLWKEVATGKNLDTTEGPQNYAREGTGSQASEGRERFALAIEMIDNETGGRFSESLTLLEAALSKSNPDGLHLQVADLSLTGLLGGQELVRNQSKQTNLAAHNGPKMFEVRRPRISGKNENRSTSPLPKSVKLRVDPKGKSPNSKHIRRSKKRVRMRHAVPQ